MEQSPCSWMSRINLRKMAVLQKVIYMFHSIHWVHSIKIWIVFFLEQQTGPEVHTEAGEILNKQNYSNHIGIKLFDLQTMQWKHRNKENMALAGTWLPFPENLDEDRGTQSLVQFNTFNTFHQNMCNILSRTIKQVLMFIQKLERS